MDLAAEFLSSTINAFESNKKLADKAIAQLTEEQLRHALDPSVNSIAVIMKHVAGNLLSRWTDFLTVDGEKPGRQRDDEFIDTFPDRQSILDRWEQGWTCLFASLHHLTSTDLSRSVVIRGEVHTVPLAIQRSLGHTCYHVGQIVQVARILAGPTWTTLTIERGQSDEFNRQTWGPGSPYPAKSD